MLEKRIDELEHEVAELKKLISTLCDKIYYLENMTERGLSLYDQIKNKPFLKGLVK